MIAAGCVSRNIDDRPCGREVTRPQSRRHARCFDTVDWARPRCSGEIDDPVLAERQVAQDRQPRRVAEPVEEVRRRDQGGWCGGLGGARTSRVIAI